jgi:hypothetical protein
MAQMAQMAQMALIDSEGGSSSARDGSCNKGNGLHPPPEVVSQEKWFGCCRATAVATRRVHLRDLRHQRHQRLLLDDAMNPSPLPGRSRFLDSARTALRSEWHRAQEPVDV